MATVKKRPQFLDSEVGIEVERKLYLMTQDVAFNTGSSYSPDGELYPDNLIPFVDKHMNYLCKHPAIDPAHYLANLRLMTRVR
ncbi:MAG: hypothetical protein ACQR33_06125 [Candidatus Saccharibacteria bacterium]